MRWKLNFDKLLEGYKGNSQDFSQSIHKLTALNSKNPSVENIYFEASKFIAKDDKLCAILFYIHYIYADLQSSKFDNKQLTKTVQRSLFTSDAQLKDFEKIVTDLVNSKDLKKALEQCEKFYIQKRKKIELDKNLIAEAHQKHSGTVELLNEYLRDEQGPSDLNDNKNEDATEIKIATVKPMPSESGSNLKDIQKDLLEMFNKNGLTVTKSEIESFAKSQGLFRNQLIESINDTCYEVIDDVLIEEEEDSYTINSDYFNKILAI